MWKRLHRDFYFVDWWVTLGYIAESVFCFWPNSFNWARASSFTRFLNHTRLATVGSTPLGAWSARRRYLCLTTHNTHNRRTSIPPVGFEPTISAGERPQTYALDRAATGTGRICILIGTFCNCSSVCQDYLKMNLPYFRSISLEAQHESRRCSSNLKPHDAHP